MKPILNPVEYAQKAVHEYISLYGPDLVSVILYGSAAGGDYDPLQSDINLLIVLSSMDLELISKSADIQIKLFQKRFSRPLFMDKKYIDSSCDSYPLEFLDMKEHYVVLAGEDVLSTINPQIADLRLQVERELKGKWLHLIDEYTFACKNQKNLVQLTDISLKTFMPLFRALLKFKGVPVPVARKELLPAVESAYSIDGSPFQAMDKLRKGGNLTELKTNFSDYSKAIKKLIDTIENI
ncbi:MAG: nucleotidyltransferase domain-containing protein [Fibrobacter sp.]|jgi:predicted nucleotidyltransferase|nr:nucleotidyltransferase domain-containing protein [Fibrobacter sp.]